MRNPLVSMRTVITALGSAVVVAFLAAAQQPAQTLDGKTAEQVYKNIQVLQGTPADQVIPAMRVMNAALGVDCEFCHVEDDSKDDKLEKKTARDMMTMMFEINKTRFKDLPGGPTLRQFAVTCDTCHHGVITPVSISTIPELATMTTQAAPKPAAATPPTVDQILAKYVDALGGEQALRKVTSRVATSTLDLPPGPGDAGSAHATAQHFFKAPDLNAFGIDTHTLSEITSEVTVQTLGR